MSATTDTERASTAHERIAIAAIDRIVDTMEDLIAALAATINTYHQQGEPPTEAEARLRALRSPLAEAANHLRRATDTARRTEGKHWARNRPAPASRSRTAPNAPAPEAEDRT